MTNDKVIYPMLAGTGNAEKLWDDENWVAEEKIDGFRYIMQMGEEGNRLTSRQRSVKTGLPVDKTENVPHLAKLVSKELAGTILDGELRHDDFSKTGTVMGSGKERAIEVQKKLGYIRYHVFDILEHRGRNVRGVPYFRRRQILIRTVEEIHRKNPLLKGILQMTLVVTDVKKEYYEHIVARGGEGVVLKHISSIYEDGERSNKWIKVKKYITDDVIMLGATPPTKHYTGSQLKTWKYWEHRGTGERAMRNEIASDVLALEWIPITRAYYKGMIGAIVFGKYLGGKIHILGQTSGIDDRVKEQLSNGKHDLKPEYFKMVIEIGAMEKIKKTGAYRHPRFIRLRPDKHAEDCKEE